MAPMATVPVPVWHLQYVLCPAANKKRFIENSSCFISASTMLEMPAICFHISVAPGLTNSNCSNERTATIDQCDIGSQSIKSILVQGLHR